MQQNLVPSSVSRVRSLVALLSVPVVVGFGVTACGGSDDETSGSADASTTMAPSGSDAGDPSSEDTTTSTASGASDDLCESVTAEEVGAILTEATIVAAEANDVIPAPNCDYLVSVDGIELPAVKVIREESGFYDAQKELQETQVPVDGVTDGFATDDQNTHVYLKGASGDYQIDVGVELTSGGQPASAAQMAAIAQLFAAR